jgi:hypothetical protein
LFCETNQSSQVIESEPKVRKRTASKEKLEKTPKGIRIIRLPIAELLYSETIESACLFRHWIDGLDEKYKLLFDCDLSQGYQLHDIRYSRKMSLSYRRISIGKEIYTIHPHRRSDQFYHALLEWQSSGLSRRYYVISSRNVLR